MSSVNDKLSHLHIGWFEHNSAAGGEKRSRQASAQGVSNVNDDEAEESLEASESTPEEEESRTRDSEDNDNSPESKTSLTQ